MYKQEIQHLSIVKKKPNQSGHQNFCRVLFPYCTHLTGNFMEVNNT